MDRKIAMEGWTVITRMVNPDAGVTFTAPAE